MYDKKYIIECFQHMHCLFNYGINKFEVIEKFNLEFAQKETKRARFLSGFVPYPIS